MENELIKITFNSKITPVKPINDYFTLCKCYVMAIGKNDNKTIISKETVDDALPTLFNIPVVGHLYADEDGVIRVGGHDVVLEKDDDGKYRFTSVTVPYGVVPQDNNVYYEEVEETDGTKNTYLVADIILWTGRYPELLDAIYSDEIYFSQSMEIMLSDKKKTKDGLEITKFQFSALCLLGKSDDKSKDVKPCFKSARVEPYKFSDAGNWTDLFTEFKEQLAKSYSAIDVVKGGEKTLNTETIKKILLDFGLSEDTVLSFDVADDMTEEELKAKIQETYFKDNQSGEAGNGVEDAGGVTGEPVATNDEPEGGKNEFSENVDSNETVAEEPLKFALEKTYEERRDALVSSLCALERHDSTCYVWYCLIDFDNSYVYTRFHKLGMNMPEESGTIRIPYTMDEDKAVIELDRNEKVRQVWLTKEDEDKISAEKAQFAELAQYKENRILEDKRQSYAAIISEFSDLGEIDEYKTVVKEAMSFESADALAEKLYAIRGKNAGNISKKSLNEIRIPVGFEKKSLQSEYDEFMSRYLAPSEK